MNIHELATYNLDDAVKFHQRLNPVLWARDEHLLPEVRNKLLRIAADFQEFLGVEDLKVKDITVSGSNAAYSYTKQSDIDLHLVVEMPNDPVYQELFAAKKYQYNTEHDITIGGADVELYVQPDDQPHHSQGIYSIKNSDWVKVPQRKRSQIDDTCVLAKVDDLSTRIKSAIASQDRSVMDSLWKKIKIMRQSGLENHGEFGCENVSFKLLRNNGSIGALKSAITAAQDRELSLPPKKRVRYGFSEDVTSTPDGVSASTNMFLNETPVSSVVQSFVQDVVRRLGIENMPEVVLHDDPDWSKQNNSFGQYNPDTRTLHVSLVDRHLLDILRTVAHELTHCRQNELDTLPDHAGETGSRWENQANAQAGILMRYFADANPEYFTESYTQAKSLQSSMKTFRAKVRIKDRYGSPAIEAQVVARNHDMARQMLRAQYGPDSVISTVTELKENASGYIPKNKKEAKMPQYAMALSVDIKPGEVGRQANKLALKTGGNGEPGLLQPDAQNLLREFTEFVTEQENLFEISMSPTSLKKLSAQTDAMAGMEFEMIVPGVKGEDQDQEPDYDYDERARSIDDICNFFYDGDFNGRRQIDDLRRRLTNSYEQWADDQIQEDWDNQGMDLLYQYVKNNVDDETIIEALGLESDEEGNPPTIGRAEWAQYAELCMEEQNDVYDEALQEFRDDWYNDDDHESDWLDSEGLEYMSNVEQEYGGLVTWPHWNDPNAGETDVEQVADNFSAAIGRKVNWSRNYHGGKREPNAYVVEPDGSLDPNDDDDAGLEFVSPPLPIEELLSDLNTVKAWADKTGCYTNDSTGLHINVSVPGWSGDYNKLDYVKLALLLGDEYVLDVFGRAGNTYAKSAMSKIRSIIKQNPAKAEELLTKMKSGMDQLASKAIHSGVTEKYTSINTKTGYIEFRSPGGDWLDANFDKIENTLRRFTVALSAAVDPEAYRQEYLKKLYKLLDVSSEKDPLSYFAKYSAGELPKAALKSFVRQAQLERGVRRGKETGPMWWKVSNPPQSFASIEVVASSQEEAIQKALGPDGYPNWANTINSVVAEPVRPYKEEPAAQQPQGVDTRVDYELYDRTTNAVIDTFPARNDDEARTRLDDYRQFGAGQRNPNNFGVRRGPGVSAAASTTASPPEGGGRPHDPTGRYAIVARSDRAAYGRRGGPAPNYQFRFNMGNPEEQRHGRYVLQAWAARNNVNAADYMVVDTEEYADSGTAQDLPNLFPDIPAPQPAGMGQWNGQWRVLVNGQEVYRFGGVGNSQADANRIAAAWLRDNGQGVSGEGFEVYPVMAESLHEAKGDRRKFADGYLVFSDHLYDRLRDHSISQEAVESLLRKLEVRRSVDLVKLPYIEFVVKTPDLALAIAKTRDRDDRTAFVVSTVRQSLRSGPEQDVIYLEDQPQPSHGPGAIKDLNEPLGPETPPTMPAGTVKVDVSDVYDWYKLGQHISNMKGLGQHDFGQGPPSAILSFGDEDLEHEYIQALKRTGLTTTDIDPVDPNQPPGMPRQKTDPTYNVDENFADGKNPGRKGLSKRMGVNTKASVSDLRKTAKNSSGEKQRMAHWLANMKAGRAKAKRK